MKVYEIYVDAGKHFDVAKDIEITYQGKKLSVTDSVMTLLDVEENKEFFEAVKDRLVEVDNDE